MDNIIVFDMDGVLVDSISLMQELNQTKYPGSTRKDFEHLFTGNIAEQIDNLKEIYGANQAEQEKYLQAYTKKKTETVEMYPGVYKLVDTLRQEGYLLAINTSASDNNTMNLLDRLNIKDNFDTILTRDVVRSKQEKFLILAQRYQCNTSDFIFITDSLGDVKEAHALDIPTIVVTWGIHDRSYFDTTTHNNIIAIVDSVEQLTEEILKRKK